MTSTQVRPLLVAAPRTFATASVATTTVLADSALSFTAADVGKTVATANVPGTAVIASITDSGHAVMSQAATGTSGPQTCTLTPPATGARTFTTASVATTTVLTDSANGFTAADVGKTVTTANVPGTAVIASITDAGHAVMSQAATSTSGPQSCTLTPTFVNATFNALAECAKNTNFGQGGAAVLAPGMLGQALAAVNIWHNNPTGPLTGYAQKIARAAGLQIQDA